MDFIVQKDEIYPIEVKAEENLRAKSLRTVYDSNPALKPCRFFDGGLPRAGLDDECAAISGKGVDESERRG